MKNIHYTYSSVGLERGTVKLLPHSDEWDTVAKITVNELKEILGDMIIDIQHVGSTSIKAITAKPIIDIIDEADTYIKRKGYNLQ